MSILIRFDIDKCVDNKQFSINDFATNYISHETNRKEKFRQIRLGKLAYFLTNMNFHLFFLVWLRLFISLLMLVVLFKDMTQTSNSIREEIHVLTFERAVFSFQHHTSLTVHSLEGLKQWFCFWQFYVYLNLFDRIDD